VRVVVERKQFQRFVELFGIRKSQTPLSRLSAKRECCAYIGVWRTCENNRRKGFVDNSSFILHFFVEPISHPRRLRPHLDMQRHQSLRRLTLVTRPAYSVQESLDRERSLPSSSRLVVLAFSDSTSARTFPLSFTSSSR